MQNEKNNNLLLEKQIKQVMRIQKNTLLNMTDNNKNYSINENKKAQINHHLKNKSSINDKYFSQSYCNNNQNIDEILHNDKINNYKKRFDEFSARSLINSHFSKKDFFTDADERLFSPTSLKNTSINKYQNMKNLKEFIDTDKKMNEYEDHN